MIRLIAFAVFALALATSAEALPRVPLHQPDGISTEARYRGVGVARATAIGATATAAIGTTAITMAIGPTATMAIGTTATAYGYRPYGYRPYGYGVARGIARRNIRRGILR